MHFLLPNIGPFVQTFNGNVFGLNAICQSKGQQYPNIIKLTIWCLDQTSIKLGPETSLTTASTNTKK